MAREVINPKSLYTSIEYGFSHATKSSGKCIIHCAGQVAWNKEHEVVGPNDLATQTRQVLSNLRTALTEAGATPADIVRMRTYVVNHKPEYLKIVGPEIAKFYGEVTPAANTFIGVQSLALPDFLIELEATAQIE